MELKDWNEYTFEEKEALLHHWWQYYALSTYTLDEWMQFDEMIIGNVDKICEAAFCCYINQQGPKPILEGMRRGVIDEFLKLLPEMEEQDSKLKMDVFFIKQTFLEMIVDSYNNPDSVVVKSPGAIENEKTAKIGRQKRKERNG